MNEFNAVKTKKKVVKWIHNWFLENGSEEQIAVVGISGGVNSTVTAALCTEALGKDHVIGAILPNLSTNSTEESLAVCKELGIRYYIVPISASIADLVNQTGAAGLNPNVQSLVNLPARIRMAALYYISQSLDGRVVNTTNLSERKLGYYTIYGDIAGDLSPLGNLTKSEVVEIGRTMGIDESLLNVQSCDGLCGMYDEDLFEFTYKDLDNYIRYGEGSPEVVPKIETFIRNNEFKQREMEVFVP